MEVDGREDYYQSSESENEEAVAIAKQTSEAQRIKAQDYAADFDEEPVESSQQPAAHLSAELLEQLTDTAAEARALSELDRGLLTEAGEQYIKAKSESLDLYLLQLVLRLAMEAKGKDGSAHPVSESIAKMNNFLQNFQQFDEALNHQAASHTEEPPPTKRAKIAHVSFQDALEKSESESENSSEESAPIEPKKHAKSSEAIGESGDSHDRKGTIRRAKSEILKPKGLVRKRKPTERNPRVKNRLKYEKAEKKRRSTYGYKEKEFTAYYDGERTGIRKDIVRSTKLS